MFDTVITHIATNAFRKAPYCKSFKPSQTSEANDINFVTLSTNKVRTKARAITVY